MAVIAHRFFLSRRNRIRPIGLLHFFSCFDIGQAKRYRAAFDHLVDCSLAIASVLPNRRQTVRYSDSAVRSPRRLPAPQACRLAGNRFAHDHDQRVA